MNLYEAHITKNLEIRGKYGYLSLSVAFLTSTVFYTVSGGVKYKILKHVKVNGDGSHEFKIKRCDTLLGEFDLNLLKKDQKIKTQKNYYSYTAGYNI